MGRVVLGLNLLTCKLIRTLLPIRNQLLRELVIIKDFLEMFIT